MQHLKSERGSVFIGLMTLITVGILMHVIFMQTYWFQTQYYLQERFNEDAQSFASQTRMLLSNPNICRQVFEGKDLSSFEKVVENSTQMIALNSFERVVFGRSNVPYAVRVTEAGVLGKPLEVGAGFELRSLNFLLSPAGQIGNPRKINIPVYFSGSAANVVNCYATAFVNKAGKVDEAETIEEHACDMMTGGSFKPTTGLCG